MIFRTLKARIILSTVSVVLLSLSFLTYYQVVEAKKKLTEQIEKKAISVTQITRDYIKMRHQELLKNGSKMYLLKKELIKSKVDAIYKIIESNHNFLISDGINLNHDRFKQHTFDEIKIWGQDNQELYLWINDTNKLSNRAVNPVIYNFPNRNLNCTDESGVEVTEFVKISRNVNESIFTECKVKSQQNNKEINTKENLENKGTRYIVYARKFKDWNWTIGMAISLADIDQSIKDGTQNLIKEIAEILKPQEIGETGYYYIFRGDGYMPFHPTIQGINATQLKNPETGNSIIADLKAAAHLPGKELNYLWDRPEDKGNYIYRKSSFISYYQPLDWYIASSLYLDDLNTFIEPFISRALTIFIIFVCITVVISLIISRMVTKPVRDLVSVVKNTDEDGIPLGEMPEAKSVEGAVLIDAIKTMITAVSHSRSNLVETVKKFRGLVESLSDVMWELDIHGKTSYISPKVFDSLGYTPEELIGKRLYELVETYDTERFKLLMQQVYLEQQSINNLIVNFNHKDNRRIIIELSAYPYYDENEEFCGVRGISRDITDKIKQDRELREIEEKFKLLTDQLILGTLIIQKGKIVYCNDAVLNIFQVTKNTIESLQPYELLKFVHSDDKNFISDLLKQREGGFDGLTNNEWKMVNDNGEIGWVETWAKTVCLDGESADFILIHDISQKKKAENEVQQLRNYLINIIDSMPSIVIGINLDGEITLWNKTAETRTGISFEQAKEKHINDVIPEMSELAVEIEQSIQKQEATRSKRSYITENKNIVEEITVFPLTSKGFEGAVILIDDISDKVKIEEMMIQNEKMLSIAGLAAGMAHEINNPLAGMMQTASVLANRLVKRVDMSPNQLAAKSCGTTVETIKCFMEARDIPRMLEKIIESGSRAALIVNNMLSFSRKNSESIASTNIEDLIETTVNLAQTDYNLKKQYDFKQIIIEREYQKALPFLYCHQAKIQQVIFNLLRNSAQAMHAAKIDNPKITIRVYITDKKEEIQKLSIEVEDNGPGIPEKIRKRIFEPFYTTKPVGEGTGLGLSVSYYIIVDEHGGEMRVISAEGRGAKFQISLPLVPRKSSMYNKSRINS